MNHLINSQVKASKAYLTLANAAKTSVALFEMHKNGRGGHKLFCELNNIVIVFTG
jgi:hypothetical protein